MNHVCVTPNKLFSNWIILYKSDSVESNKWKLFILEINDREKISKVLNKYITLFDYTNNALLVLSVAGKAVSLFKYTTVICTTAGIASACISLAFRVTYGIVNMFLKTIGGKNINTEKLFYFRGVN